MLADEFDDADDLLLHNDDDGFPNDYFMLMF